jgi:Lon-like protease
MPLGVYMKLPEWTCSTRLIFSPISLLWSKGDKLKALVLGIVCILLLGSSGAPWAANLVEVPIPASNEAFHVVLIAWDGRALPDPAELVWGISQVRISGRPLTATRGAFDYALKRLGGDHPWTGTLSLYYISKTSMTEGKIGGAALAIGFLAVMRGHTIKPGIALTGTIEPDGRIGPVGEIREIIKTADREGYTTVLVPSGQRYDPRWTISTHTMTSRVTVQEVGSIEEAYFLMTDQHL